MTSTPEQYVNKQLRVDGEEDVLSCPDELFMEDGEAYDTKTAHLLYVKQVDDKRRLKFKREDGREFDVCLPTETKQKTVKDGTLLLASLGSAGGILPVLALSLWSAEALLTVVPGVALALFVIWGLYMRRYDEMVQGDPYLRKTWSAGKTFKDNFIESFEEALDRDDVIRDDDGGIKAIKAKRYEATYDGNRYVFGPGFVHYYNERCLNTESVDASDSDEIQGEFMPPS